VHYALIGTRFDRRWVKYVFITLDIAIVSVLVAIRWNGWEIGTPILGMKRFLAHAVQNAQVLVTLDKDFGELAVALGARHAGIIRLVDFRYLQQGPVCARVIGQHEADLMRGAIITVERGRIRVRSPDAGQP
jgi:hypothetical protein